MNNLGITKQYFFLKEFILFSVFICFITGQSDPFSFKNISVEDGLSESTVKVIFEDHYGFIY
ncbi:uncharacterized protein METZ01_LOCUS149391, partial [marine metagenome]